MILVNTFKIMKRYI